MLFIQVIVLPGIDWVSEDVCVYQWRLDDSLRIDSTECQG